jgi:hypothetical protein
MHCMKTFQTSFFDESKRLAALSRLRDPLEDSVFLNLMGYSISIPHLGAGIIDGRWIAGGFFLIQELL